MAATFLARLHFIWKMWWRLVLTFGLPVLLSPVLQWHGKDMEDDITTNIHTRRFTAPFYPYEKHLQARAVYFLLLVASYWITECLPLPVTALLPIFLAPVMELASTDKITGSYLNNTVLLLLGGCIIAQAFEYSHLHSRVALKVAIIVGARLPILLGGIMFTCMFLSMWMNNTSTTAMMVPIIDVIMTEFDAANAISRADEERAHEIKRKSEFKARHSEAAEPSTVEVKKEEDGEEVTPAPTPQEMPNPPETVNETPNVEGSMDDLKEKSRNLKNMFLLGVAFASNIGGIGIITGTGTNLIAQSALKARLKIIKEHPHVKNYKECTTAYDLTFLNWFEFNVVPMLVCTVVTWGFLVIWFLGCPRRGKSVDKEEAESKKQITHNIERAIKIKYSHLGKITLHEILVLILFLILILLWLTGKVGTSGWFTLDAFTDYFVCNISASHHNPECKSEINYPSEGVTAMIICIFLFILPKDGKYYKDFWKGGWALGMNDPLLPWHEVETKVPWGPLLMIGGGIAISTVMRDSGLSAAIGVFLQENEALNKLHPPVYLILILLFVGLLTSVASNTATASILSPVLIQLSVVKHIHPFYFLVTATTSASFAFMLPISTPPNAIVYDKSDGNMKQKDMAKPGSVLTLLNNFILYVMVHTYCSWIFNFNDYAKTKPCMKV